MSGLPEVEGESPAQKELCWRLGGWGVSRQGEINTSFQETLMQEATRYAIDKVKSTHIVKTDADEQPRAKKHKNDADDKEALARAEMMKNFA